MSEQPSSENTPNLRDEEAHAPTVEEEIEAQRQDRIWHNLKIINLSGIRGGVRPGFRRSAAPISPGCSNFRDFTATGHSLSRKPGHCVHPQAPWVLHRLLSNWSTHPRYIEHTETGAEMLRGLVNTMRAAVPGESRDITVTQPVSSGLQGPWVKD